MPRSLLLAALFLTASLATPTVRAQFCVGDITLSSQAEVDAFNCAEMSGRLTISGGDITDLTPLSVLTSVGSGPFGGLYIRDNAALESLEGLESITSINSDLWVRENAALASLAGLEGLTTVGYRLWISINPTLASLAGLESLTSLVGLFIEGNATLTSLAGLESLTTIEAGSNSFINITDNDALTSLTGLDGVTSLDGGLAIEGNPALASLAGLESLTSLGRLYLTDNDALSSLAGFESLDSLGYLTIEGNAALTSAEGFEGLTSLGGLTLRRTAITSLAGFEVLASVVTNLHITDNDMLRSLEGLESVTAVSGRCSLDGCNGGVSIQGNPALTSFDGLENVTSVNDLNISDNAALTECACGLSGLISGDPPMFTGVDGEVIVASNAPDGACTSPEVVLDASVDAMCMPVASEPTAGVPDRFALSAPYPNPFRGRATMGFAVPEASDVRLVVYDVLGREVAVLLDGPVAAAHHEVALDGSRLPSGTYLVRMTTAGGFSQTQRVTVVR